MNFRADLAIVPNGPENVKIEMTAQNASSITSPNPYQVSTVHKTSPEAPVDWGDAIVVTASPGFFKTGPDSTWASTRVSARMLTWADGDLLTMPDRSVSISADGSKATVTVPSIPPGQDPESPFGDVWGGTKPKLLDIVVEENIGPPSSSAVVRMKLDLPQPEINGTIPAIEGTAIAGSRLVANPGAWDFGTNLSYQWRRNGGAIPGETRLDYAISSEDVGTTLTITTTGTLSTRATTVRTSTPTASVRASATGSSPTAPVYRFYKTDGAHFYTSNTAEKTNVIATASASYRYEGIAFNSYPTKVTGTTAVHRFYNFRSGVHFYTSTESEFLRVKTEMAFTYRYEGIAYYARTARSTAVAPVYRFYNLRSGVHFYTTNASEAAGLRANHSTLYRDEGVAYYLPPS